MSVDMHTASTGQMPPWGCLPFEKHNFISALALFFHFCHYRREEKEKHMYSFETRVRYSECNTNNRAGLTTLLDYLQDCCTFQSEYLGIGLEFLNEHHAAWLLSAWQVDILRYPLMGERLRIFTWPYGLKGIYGLRNFKIEDGGGEVILKADSVWVFIDTQTGKPARPMQEMHDKYPAEPRLEMEYLGRKLPELAEGEKKTPVRVPHYFIDTNHHVNNAKYILMGEEFLPEGFAVGRIRAEYKKAAVLGDVIVPSVAAGQEQVSVRLSDEDGAAYANIIFYGKKESR